MSSVIKKQSSNEKVRRKISKAQMQLAIIKKKQCDTRALAIVNQLLEPNVDVCWLLQNLEFINKCHMIDAIEERAITKLCGYVLCSKQLINIIKQQYHISTHRNKVYDISRRKNFCSSLCYSASNYLLEQMLESPLWLREHEDIPVFRILNINNTSAHLRTELGDEIDVGTNLASNVDSDSTNSNKDISPTISSDKTKNNTHLADDIDVEKMDKVEETCAKIDTLCLSEAYSPGKLHSNQENENDNSREQINYKNDCDNRNAEKADIKLENSHIQTTIRHKDILHSYKSHDKNMKNRYVDIVSHNNSEILQPQLDASNKSHKNDSRVVQLQLKKAFSSQNTTTHSESSDGKREDAGKRNKSEKYEQKKFNNTKIQINIPYNFAAHVEQSIKEWITEDTFCLLLNLTDKKCQMLENLMQCEKYEKLCKKLNRLQLQEKRNDYNSLEKSMLKPMPGLSTLQEEGKKIELKVRAFYEGRMTIASPSEESNKESEREEKSKDKDSVLPLTDVHTPNMLRRRIFLDKLSKILPDLLCTLTANASIYNNERYSLIKLLIGTFNFSATNIVFKTAEWTLVGLIIIKILSLIDAQLQSLLGSKQVSMYTSMILMSYKLDSNYLDRLIMEITNNI